MRLHRRMHALLSVARRVPLACGQGQVCGFGGMGKLVAALLLQRDLQLSTAG